MLHKILLLTLLITSGTFTAFAQKNKEPEKKLKSIPEDFNAGYVLLIQIDGPTEAHIKSHPLGEKKVRAWWDKQMNEKKDYAKKKISAPYEIVTSFDVFSEDSKYDVTKYRYALIDSVRTTLISKMPSSTSKGYMYQQDFHQFYIWDRQTNTLHPGVGVGRGTEIKAFKSAIDRLAGVK